MSTEQAQQHIPLQNLKILQVILDEFVKTIEEFLTSYLDKIGMAWWVEIITKKPDCTYYFSPFVSHREAQLSQLGYIEDLERERPQLIAIEIKQCKPKELTIFKDEGIEKTETVETSISRDISA